MCYYFENLSLFFRTVKTHTMHKHTLVAVIALASFFSSAQSIYDHEKIEAKSGNESNLMMGADAIYADNWDQLAQPQFWKKIMLLSPDTFLVNVAATREILEVISVKDWSKQTEVEKDLHRDSLRKQFNLPADERIFVTSGKKDFYKFDVVYPTISQGVDAFERNGVDPWYAQAILLIESPGQLKKSSAGAYGPFQLMPAVARHQGLTVNRSVDERKDFERSAYASSRLIKTICIPEAKRILEQRNIDYSESDLWFRLFVLHVYHAGSLNVAAVVDKIAPEMGGKSLIQAMWQNTAASFGNNSQNYSQLALASQLILNELIYAQCDYVLDCKNTFLE